MPDRQMVTNRDAKALAKIATTQGRARRSALWNYMRDNYAVLQETIRPRNADWNGVTEIIHALGLNDRTGKLPTAGTVQKTWSSVQRFMKTTQSVVSARPALLPDDWGALPNQGRPPVPRDRSHTNKAPVESTPTKGDRAWLDED